MREGERGRTSRSRRMATMAIVVVLAGSAVSIASGREMWPFSPYQMYSRPDTGPVTMLSIEGRGPEGWFALTERHVHPFTRSTLRGTLRRPARSPERVERALLAVSEVYERERTLAHHDGPRLAGLRVVRLSWSHLGEGWNDRPPDDETVLGAISFEDAR